MFGDWQKQNIIRATNSHPCMEQFCSPIKTRLQIPAREQMKDSGWVPKALCKFQEIASDEEYFLVNKYPLLLWLAELSLTLHSKIH